MRWSLLLAASLLPFTDHAQLSENRAKELVNPFIGTGGHGHTFPGSCVPNGLVQLSPDTRPDPVEWDGCGGYHYSDSSIYGFSHTHLSGTGVADLCDVLLLPVTGKTLYATDGGYRSPFSHATESAHAGYYRVHLEDTGIDVELTATKRVGVHRYVYPKNKEASVVLDLRHRDKLTGSSLTISGENEVVGERRSSSWASDQRLFYCIQFSKPILPYGPAVEFYNKDIRIFNFGKLDEPLVVKVGISAVSIEGARKNIESEVPHWDFDRVQNAAENEWNEKLDKITVEGGSNEQQRIFYTALYHCYIAPYIFNDVDGQYRGMDGEIHHADHDVYTIFSLWDTYRALHPLMTILEPDMTSDWIKTFLLHYQQGGRLPVWELWGNETDCMIGYHSVSVIADAYLKGIRGFDADLALEAMLASANRDQPGLNAYRSQGYIGSEDEAESVSKTLEYAYDDACILAYIRSLNGEKLRRSALPSEALQRSLSTMSTHRSEDEHARAFMRRSENWKNLLDGRTKFFRPRKNGAFIEPFDPYEVNFHLTEANSWQYSLSVPHQIDHYDHIFPQSRILEARLVALFNADENTTGRDQADISGMIGQYAHGNEPSHHIAYLFNHVGKPELTRKYVQQIMEGFYKDSPDGLIGNEDCGQMSAWYVMSALGIYPLAPGVDTNYELGYPLFNRATINLGTGKKWVMTVEEGKSSPNDGFARTPLVLPHRRLMEGGDLKFNAEREVLSSASLIRRGSSSDVTGAAPMQCESLQPGAPVIFCTDRSFTDQATIDLRGCYDRCLIKVNGEIKRCPQGKSFTIAESCSIELHWDSIMEPVRADFQKVEHDRSIVINSEYANQYSAGGDRALIDGIRGGNDFRTGDWQGFQGQDVSIEIDLGKVTYLDSIIVGVLQDERSWIWFPKGIEVATSFNKRNWSTSVMVNEIGRDVKGSLVQDLAIALGGRKARYIKIHAKNAGVCPPGHLGAGGDSWIFMDEIIIHEQQ